MTDEHRTGVPEIDALIEVEETALNATIAVGRAENVVAGARHQDLLAGRPPPAACSPGPSGTALPPRSPPPGPDRRRAGRVRADLRRRDRRGGQQLVAARLERNGAMLEQLDRTWQAGSAITDTLTDRRPPGAST